MWEQFQQSFPAHAVLKRTEGRREEAFVSFSEDNGVEGDCRQEVLGTHVVESVVELHDVFCAC